MTLGYPRNDVDLGLKSQRSRSRGQYKCIFHTNDYYRVTHYANACLTAWVCTLWVPSIVIVAVITTIVVVVVILFSAVHVLLACACDGQPTQQGQHTHRSRARLPCQHSLTGLYVCSVLIATLYRATDDASAWGT